jgi:hypothetical protein
MAECRKCGEPIAFKLVDGKYWPTNVDGSEHFVRCKQVAFRRSGKPTHTMGPWIVGGDFDPCPHHCQTVPWEWCENCPREQQRAHIREISHERLG